MVDATWTYEIDLTRDGDFADSSEDVTSNVLEIEWQLGFSDAYDPVSRTATLSMVLNNSDKRYSPENAGSPIYGNFTNGRVVRVQSTYNSTTRTHFLGWITSIQPEFDQYGTRRTVVEAEGFWSRASRAEVFIPVQEGKTADQVIETILSNASIYPPGFTGRFLLGIVGHSELEENTILGAVSDYLSAETGKTTFNYIGDQWHDGVSVMGAIRDVVGREYGRLYIDRDGVIQFWNRHHLIKDVVSDATFNDTMVQMEYEYGQNVINKAIVTARPRLVGASAEQLGQLDKATKIEANSTRTITFRYADQSAGTRISGKDAVTPAQTTDFTAAENEDGTGTDYTTSVTASINNEYATRSEVIFTNAASVDVWLQPGAQIRGTKITDWGEIDAVSQDDDSIADYGRQEFRYRFTVDSLDEAENLAAYLENSGKDPRGNAKSMTLRPQASDALMTQALTRTIGDRTTVTETQTAISQDYFIIGEIFSHDTNDLLETTFLLEPADPQTYFLLGKTGYAELEQNSRLGPF